VAKVQSPRVRILDYRHVERGHLLGLFDAEVNDVIIRNYRLVQDTPLMKPSVLGPQYTRFDALTGTRKITTCVKLPKPLRSALREAILPFYEARLRELGEWYRDMGTWKEML